MLELASIFAHGIGSRSDLPLPFWVFSANAVAALVASFVLLVLLWPASRLAKDAEGRAVLPLSASWVGVVLAGLIRTAGLLLFGAVLWASLFSPLGAGASIAPAAIFVAFWVGVQFLAAIFGDIWRLLSPWDTLATLGRWAKNAACWMSRREHRKAESNLNSHAAESTATDRSPLVPEPPRWASASLAVGAVAVFLWMELVYPEPSETRLLGWLIFAYTISVLTGASLWGRRWLRESEGFAVLFSMIGSMGIFFIGSKAGAPRRNAKAEISGEASEDRNRRPSPARIRWPMTGLAKLEMTYLSTALVLVVLGCTTFDGLSGTLWWTNLQRGSSGWETVPMSTLGLAGCVLAVTLGYYLAMAVALRLLGQSNTDRAFLSQQAQMSFPRQVLRLGQQFSHSLVPLLVAYSVAHYFSLVFFEGQDFLALLSDPFAVGWDLFGTAHFRIDYRAVSVKLIAWVQALAIVIGHVAGVTVAHDRAVELFPRRLALRSQYPLLAVMVGYTVTGLMLLLKA